jgi:hypothetical protein
VPAVARAAVGAVSGAATKPTVIGTVGPTSDSPLAVVNVTT